MSNYIKLKCEECGATMEVDENKKIIFCPYCGSKKLIEETDAVKKAKIESATRIHEADKNAEMVKDQSNANIATARQKTLQTLFSGDNVIIFLALLAVIIMLLMI